MWCSETLRTHIRPRSTICIPVIGAQRSFLAHALPLNEASSLRFRWSDFGFIEPTEISFLNCYYSPHQHATIACDWRSSDAKKKFLVSVKDAHLVEVNNVVVYEEEVSFADRLLRVGEVYTIQVEGQSTQFTPIGMQYLSLAFNFLSRRAQPLWIEIVGPCHIQCSRVNGIDE